MVSAGPSLTPEQLRALLAVLARGGHDLRDYRVETLRRRTLDRLQEVALEPAAYLARLADDEAEQRRLAAHLLVHTTRFFRDPATFAALGRRVLPELFLRARERRAPLRAWVVGASTGEEAYSLAMLLAEQGRTHRHPASVLASDRVAQVVEQARLGTYPRAAVVAAVPAELRARYFVPRGDGLQVVQALREAVTFAVHDLLGLELAPREALLAEFDLVLCRNVLIYLDARSQVRAFERLRAVLSAGGALLLGPSEEPHAGSGFTPYRGVDEAHRLYVATEAA